MRVDAVSASSAAAVYAIYIARYTPLLWINAVYFISAEFYGSVASTKPWSFYPLRSRKSTAYLCCS